MKDGQEAIASGKHTYTAGLKKDGCKRQMKYVRMDINHKTDSSQTIQTRDSACRNRADRFL